MAARGKPRQEPWRNAERHYCAVCNMWMGSDKQSILIHENGKKHRENMEANLKQKRLDKLQEEKSQKALQASLKQMEQAAALSHAKDKGFFAAPTTQQSAAVSTHPQIIPVPIPQSQTSAASKEKQSWQARRKKREEESHAKKEKESGDAVPEPLVKKAKRQLGPDEGHYTIGDTTYLEGPTFAALLEEDMPVQIWTGSQAANLAEKRLAEKHFLWKNGLVVKIRKSRWQTDDDEGIVADVAYLMRTTDTDETLEKSVTPDRLRIVVGADQCIPDSVEEARVAVMGGEETVLNQEVAVDENTGLSSWGTVSIRRTTVRQELKEERARLRAKRRAAEEHEEKMKKEAEGRRMEEAKVENADDSALGAYDVWTSGKAGYKGVDIHKEAKLDVHETGKSLSKGMGAVEFKKRSGSSLFKKAKKKQNRRTTSADGDD